VSASVTAFAPGRVNLIGEHTDYNDGLALPFAIEGGITVRAAVRDDGQVHAVAGDLGAEDRFPVADPTAREGWAGFVRGAVGELRRAGIDVPGASLRITGTVPQGGGLSSSAALEVALSLALIALAGADTPDRIELARLCSRIENDWVGANTGLLDQLASLCGERDGAVLIDFRDLTLTPVALELGDFRLVTLDSGEQHDLATGGYNRRREECAEACVLLGVGSLREVTAPMLAGLPDVLARRARHVIEENARVTRAVAALAAGELGEVGALLDASHRSLRDLYEVSTPAVEAAAGRLREAGALGARVVGGGFGGNVLGLLPPGAEAPAQAIEVRPSPGARLIHG
jgi:galactokinase